jgi:hypothetical protein
MLEKAERHPAFAADGAQQKPWISEDWLAVWIGLLVFGLGVSSLFGQDLLGWAVTTSVWTDITKALNTASKTYAELGGLVALGLTYVALLVTLSLAAIALRTSVWRFALGFTVVFALAYASWIAGSYANFAVVTPADQAKFGISWSLKLTNEGGFIIALVAGLIIANFFPSFAEGAIYIGC